VFTIDDLWRIMEYLKDGTIDPNLSELTTILATSEKEIVKTYFENVLDQPSFNTADYQRLREMLIDWYSSLKTVSTTQKFSSDVHQLPNQHLSELFRSFGFPIGLELVPLTSKANFFLDLVNFYKKKGTPETLVDVLDYYGFSDTDLIEYWLQKDQYGNLIFRGESVRLAATGSTVLLDNDVAFNKLIADDPHWFQTKDQIESLLLSNKINLPSKSPYFSLSSIFSLYNVLLSLTIMFRIIQDQYDRSVLGLELPYNVQVRNLGMVLPLFHLYVGTVYTFEKMFGTGISTSFTNYGCYNGTVTYYGDPPIPYNISSLSTEYENLISKPTSRFDRDAKLNELINTWSRPMSENFLNSINAAEPLLQSINPDFKAIIDSWISIGDEKYLITYLLGSLDNWIRLNIDSKSPSLVTTMLGLTFRDELKDIINFFKPYRARLAYMDTAYSIKNPLTESILFDEWLLTQIETNYHDSIRPPGGYCEEILNQIPPDINHILETTWRWDTGRFFDDPPIIPTIPPEKDPFPPILCGNIEWLYDTLRKYDIPMPPEYLNFSYDSGGFYDILPYLQKCLLELIKNHPDGKICDSFSTRIEQTIIDKVGRTYYFDRNWDTGAYFDSGYEETWFDSIDIEHGVVPDGDIIPISDDPSNIHINQNFNDTINTNDSFYIVISYVGNSIITSSVGKYPSGYDTGNFYDSLTNLDVTTDGRIFEWLSGSIISNTNIYASTLNLGAFEILNSSTNINSLVSSSGLSFGIDRDFTSTISLTTQINGSLNIGAYSETITSTSSIETVVYNSELIIGIIEELSSNINMSTNFDGLLLTGDIQILSSIVINTTQAYSTTLFTGELEILNGAINISSQLISNLTVVNTLYNTRSVIIDIENNHGDSTNMALMGVRFANFGNIIDIGVPGVDYDAYATSTLEPDPYAPWRIFYYISPLTGTVENWMANNQTTNQRVICAIGNGINLDEIIFYNYHASGTDTDKGINNVKIYLSTDIISETTYDQPISNSELVFDGIIEEHSSIDELDGQSITIGIYKGSSNSTTNCDSNLTIGNNEGINGSSNLSTFIFATILSTGISEILTGTSLIESESEASLTVV